MRGTLIRTGRLAYPEDVRAVSKAMQVPEARIAEMKPLEWIEKNMQTDKVAAGKIRF